MTDLDQTLAEERRQRLRDRRERIATAALQGILACAEGGIVPKEHYDLVAMCAVGYADALIAELDKEPQP